MLIDLFVAFFTGALLDPFLGSKGYGIFVIFGLIILFFVGWLVGVIRLAKNEDKTGMWVTLLIGLLLSFLIGWIVSFFFSSKSNKEKEEEFEKRGGSFWCGICNIKLKEDFLGGETICEGKICRSCLGKKQRGEAITPPPRSQQTESPNEPIYHERKYRSNRSERKILLRELSRKQSKKNSYLTNFIINLVVLQWLLPLLAYVFFWIQIKEKMKVRALSSPGVGLTTELPFSFVIKNLFKILTSESINYGGHTIMVSVTWKITIILLFTLPLIFWIYNLVRFFSAKGEVERLEAEIKSIDR